VFPLGFSTVRTFRSHDVESAGCRAPTPHFFACPKKRGPKKGTPTACPPLRCGYPAVDSSLRASPFGRPSPSKAAVQLCLGQNRRCGIVSGLSPLTLRAPQAATTGASPVYRDLRSLRQSSLLPVLPCGARLRRRGTGDSVVDNSGLSVSGEAQSVNPSRLQAAEQRSSPPDQANVGAQRLMSAAGCE